MPPRYPLVRAARYLGVPPWDLEEQSIDWLWDALDFEWAENWAEGEAMKNAGAPARGKVP